MSDSMCMLYFIIMWVWLLSLDRFGSIVYDFKVSDVVEPKIVLFCNLPLYIIILIWIKWIKVFDNILLLKKKNDTHIVVSGI